MNKKIINRKYLAAAFFAAAAYKLLPKIQFIKSGKDQLGFYYDFYLPYSISESQIEELEKESTCMSEYAQVTLKEMLQDNAKNYLRHLGQSKREIDSENQLINLIEIDGFTDYIPEGREVENRKSLYIKLCEFISLSQDNYRVHGFVFEDSRECHKFLKKFKDYKKHNFLTIGKKRKWFNLGNQFFYYPKGIILKNKILKKISDELSSLGFKPIESHPADHVDFLKSENLGLNKVFEIVHGKNLEISEEDALNSEINVFVKQTTLILSGEFEKECISSLQSITKMLNILCFKCEFELCVPSHTKFKERKKIFEKALRFIGTEYKVKNAPDRCELKLFAEDKIGRKWNISSFRLNENSVESYFCSSLNRWLALLTESDKLGFGFLPEHVRIIPLDEKYTSYTEQVKGVIQKDGFNVEIDSSDKPLNEKIFDAKMQDIPFIAVIGENEARSEMIALRSDNGSKINMVKLCELLEKLNRKEKIEN